MVPISSRAQRCNETESLSIIMNRGTQVIIRMRDNRRFMVEMQFGINVLNYFWKIASFRCFQSDREFIPDPRRSNRESTFAQVKFYL